MSALTDSMDELQLASMSKETGLQRIADARVSLVKTIRALLVSAGAKQEALQQFDKQHKSYIE